MILAIDIGNSNIVLGGVREKEILFQARIVTDHIKTSDQYCAELKTMLDLFGVSAQEIEGSIVASVVPPVLNSFRTAIRKLTGKSCLVVGPGLKTGLNILIDNPAQTGADLVAGAVAALREYQPPLIVVDMGTATTISVLDQNGSLIGGCVCPSPAGLLCYRVSAWISLRKPLAGIPSTVCAAASCWAPPVCWTA